MSAWWLDPNGNVRKVGQNAHADDVYVGRYDQALKYFGVQPDDERRGWGDLKMVIMYHQTSQRAAPKLSSELVDMLVHLQSEKKYLAPEGERMKLALQAVKWACKAGLVNDESLIKSLQKSERKVSHDRIWAHERWVQQNGDVQED